MTFFNAANTTDNRNGFVDEAEHIIMRCFRPLVMQRDMELDPESGDKAKLAIMNEMIDEMYDELDEIDYQEEIDWQIEKGYWDRKDGWWAECQRAAKEAPVVHWPCDSEE